MDAVFPFLNGSSCQKMQNTVPNVEKKWCYIHMATLDESK